MHVLTGVGAYMRGNWDKGVLYILKNKMVIYDSRSDSNKVKYSKNLFLNTSNTLLSLMGGEVVSTSVCS